MVQPKNGLIFSSIDILEKTGRGGGVHIFVCPNLVFV